MNAEQYCRETAEACGYDLTDAEWFETSHADGVSGSCLWIPMECENWHPHTNVAQALEVARVRGMELYIGRNVVDSACLKSDVPYADHPTTEAAVCAAIQACWEAGRGD